MPYSSQSPSNPQEPRQANWELKVCPGIHRGSCPLQNKIKIATKEKKRKKKNSKLCPWITPFSILISP
jgi:hypothetical protein